MWTHCILLKCTLYIFISDGYRGYYGLRLFSTLLALLCFAYCVLTENSDGDVLVTRCMVLGTRVRVLGGALEIVESDLADGVRLAVGHVHPRLHVGPVVARRAGISVSRGTGQNRVLANALIIRTDRHVISTLCTRREHIHMRDTQHEQVELRECKPPTRRL